MNAFELSYRGLTMILATLMLGARGLSISMSGAIGPTLLCPVMGSQTGLGAETFDYKGVRYSSCCAGCAEKFAADPEKFVKSAAANPQPTGRSLYDPVSRMRVKPMPNLPYEIYRGVLYIFENAEDKTRFHDNPGEFTAVPEREVLHCPVIDVTNAEPALSPSYFDADGMRVYLCCYGCINPSKLHIAELAKKAKPTATKAVVHIVTAEDLKKEVEAFH